MVVAILCFFGNMFTGRVISISLYLNYFLITCETPKFEARWDIAVYSHFRFSARVVA